MWKWLAFAFGRLLKEKAGVWDRASESQGAQGAESLTGDSVTRANMYFNLSVFSFKVSPFDIILRKDLPFHAYS